MILINEPVLAALANKIQNYKLMLGSNTRIRPRKRIIKALKYPLP